MARVFHRLEDLEPQIGLELTAGDSELGYIAFENAVSGHLGALGGRVLRSKINSPLKKTPLTVFHSMGKDIATKAVSPSSETMRTI